MDSENLVSTSSQPYPLSLSLFLSLSLVLHIHICILAADKILLKYATHMQKFVCVCEYYSVQKEIKHKVQLKQLC